MQKKIFIMNGIECLSYPFHTKTKNTKVVIGWTKFGIEIYEMSHFFDKILNWLDELGSFTNEVVK